MGDTLFLTKGKDPTNDAVFRRQQPAQGDLLRTRRALVGADGDSLELRVRFGVGLGLVFGNLQNNWVYPGGTLVADNGEHYQECPGQNHLFVVLARRPHQRDGCQSRRLHRTQLVQRWIGSNHLSESGFSRVGFRYKPIKMLETRLQTGFSLTGFWFGISADYGLEKRSDAAGSATRYPVQSPLSFAL